MKWTGLMIVPALFLCGCGESYETIYSKPYVVVCSGVRNNWFREIDTKRLSERVNDYVNHGYTVSGNLTGTRGEICQTLERMNNE